MKRILSKLLVVVLVASTVLSSAHAFMNPKRAADCIFKLECSADENNTKDSWLINASDDDLAQVAARGAAIAGINAGRAREKVDAQKSQAKRHVVLQETAALEDGQLDTRNTEAKRRAIIRIIADMAKSKKPLSLDKIWMKIRAIDQRFERQLHAATDLYKLSGKKSDYQRIFEILGQDNFEAVADLLIILNRATSDSSVGEIATKKDSKK